MTTSVEAVAAIATVFSAIEKHQREAIRDVRALRDKYQAVQDNGDAGALVTMSAFAAFDDLVTGQYADTLGLHMHQTAIADAHGIDAGPIATSEKIDGSVTPLSGGR